MRRWIEGSPYAGTLGVELTDLDGESARLRLPFRAGNSNGDGVLHGGCAASLAALGAQAVTRAALGEDSGPWHTAQLQLHYLSAAREQAVLAEASLQRQGKALCFVEVAIRGEDGRSVAHASAVTRARAGGEPVVLPPSSGDHGKSDPGKMGPHIGRIPFVGERGIRVEHMVDASSRLVMPYRDENADAAGGVHEGALLALLDTTGAMAAWAVTGFGPFKAGTPSLQAELLAAPPRQDLVAYGRHVHRDREIFHNEVEVAGAGDGRVWARGAVLYRIIS